MKILLSARMTGQHARNAFYAFLGNGLLHSYHTRIAFVNGGLASKLMKCSLFGKIKRRMYYRESKGYIVSYWFDEVLLVLIRRTNIKLISKKYSDLKYQNHLFDKRVAKYLENHYEEISMVYAYEGTAYETFLTAKKYGIKCVYELPIGYWREKVKINSELCEKYPEWKSTMSSISETEESKRIKDEELRLADVVIVPSTFVLNTLSSFTGKLPPTKVIQYGSPKVNKSQCKVLNNKERLKILFCGSLSQRKGIANVFSVCDRLRDKVELTVIGGGNINGCQILRDNLKQCNYIPSVSHDDLLDIMGEQDIFFFPSYFEGFALVIFDSMSQGLPVITTNVTSGPIRNGYDGWIVSPGNELEMELLINNLYSNRLEIEACSKNAITTASCYSWEYYQKELVSYLTSFDNE